jgi:hypothetical protein
LGNLKERDHMEDLGVYCKIITIKMHFKDVGWDNVHWIDLA